MRTRMRWLLLLLVAAMGAIQVVLQAQETNAAVLKNDCVRVCGAYETCVVVDGVEACAVNCGPGRCNDATEVCVIQARACTSSPCLPVSVCEPKSSQLQVTLLTLSEDDSPSAAACARQCPMANAPVCGSDGMSYTNQCFFEQAQCMNARLTIAYTQLCLDDVTLNAQYNPAPPSTTASTTSTSASTLIDAASCDAIVCATVADPVCTSVGTMQNLCYWAKAKCLDPSVSLVKRTACDASPLMPTCPTNCTEEFVPVCGSNGLLYGNECLFRMAKCERQAFAELTRTDLSYCEQQVGDSEGMASDISELLLASVS